MKLNRELQCISDRVIKQLAAAVADRIYKEQKDAPRSEYVAVPLPTAEPEKALEIKI